MLYLVEVSLLAAAIIFGFAGMCVAGLYVCTQAAALARSLVQVPRYRAQRSGERLAISR